MTQSTIGRLIGGFKLALALKPSTRIGQIVDVPKVTVSAVPLLDTFTN